MKNLIILLFLMMGKYVFGQIEVNYAMEIETKSIAILDIEPDQSPIVFDYQNIDLAGNGFDPELFSDDQKWINFTSAIQEFSTTRKIEAELMNYSQSDPFSIFIKVEQKKTGRAKGEIGESISNDYISLNDLPTTLIRRIGGAITGDGDRAYRLSFKCVLSDLSELEAGNQAGTFLYTLLYTITDE